jgi:hypothetical protein
VRRRGCGRQRLPRRIALIPSTRAGLRAGPLLVALVLTLVYAGDARAHSPFTAIGRAVEAFGSVSVSYEPGAAVSEVEAGNFTTFVGSNPQVAFMPAEAATELAGGTDAIAEEIAREAELDGTVIVLVGTELGTWSEDVGNDRLAELEAEAKAGGGSPAATVEALVRRVQAESTSDTPWPLLIASLVLLLSAAFVAYHRLVRRPATAGS